MIQETQTVQYVEGDEVLVVNQDYRIMTPGIDLTLPVCVAGDHMCIVPFMTPGDAVNLKRAHNVTLDGSGSDSDMSASGTTVLRATGTNTWIKI